METVLDGLLVHRHAAAFALASLLAVLQLLLGLGDAPIDIGLPSNTLRQLVFRVRTLLRFGRVRFVCVHRRRKYRSARAPSGVSARTAGVARAWPGRPCGIHHAQNAASREGAPRVHRASSPTLVEATFATACFGMVTIHRLNSGGD